MNRKKLFLFVAVLLFLLSLVYSYLRMPQEKTVTQLKFAPGSVATPRKTEVVAGRDDVKLHLELLDGEVYRFSGFRRNIFHPIFHEELKVLLLPPPPPPPVKQPIQAKLPAEPPVAQGPALPPPPEIPSVVKDMAKFTFLGFVKSENMKTIFLSKENRIFLVKKGSKIEDKYEVTNLTDEALTITALGEEREMIIPLVENKPLSAAKK